MRQADRFLTFIHIESFERSTAGWLDDASLNTLQLYLSANPEAGDVVPETGGVRKVRVALPGRGKRGGARVIYLYRAARGVIYLMLGYPKNVQSDLTSAQKKALKQVVARLQEER